MQEGVFDLLEHAGIHITASGRSDRDYRPELSLPGFEAKLLKPQNIVEMLHVGSRDLGFAGADWVAEKEAELVELVDTASRSSPAGGGRAGSHMLKDGRLPTQHLVVASEYERLTRHWIETTQPGRPPSCVPTARPRFSRPRTPTASSTTRRPARPCAPTGSRSSMNS